MNSNAGAADIWEKYINSHTITSGSAVIPENDNNFLYGMLEFKKSIQAVDDKRNNDLLKQFDRIMIEYLKHRLKQEKEEFDLKKHYGKCIFYTVIALVIIGVKISFFQFYLAYKSGDFSQLETEFSIQQSSNFIIKTSLIGAIILIISIIFFFLFLKYIYKTKIQSGDTLGLIRLIQEIYSS